MSFNDDEVLRKGAECLGHLATAGGTTIADTIEKRFNECLECLEGEKSKIALLARKQNQIIENKKFSAVLIIKEFCLKMPIIAFN